MTYWYGMRLRGCSLGCQPKDFLFRKDADGLFKRYYDIIVYERRLSEEEVEHFSLDFLGVNLEGVIR